MKQSKQNSSKEKGKGNLSSSLTHGRSNLQNLKAVREPNQQLNGGGWRLEVSSHLTA